LAEVAETKQQILRTAELTITVQLETQEEIANFWEKYDD